MSLFDQLNNDSNSTSSLTAQMQLLIQQASAKSGNLTAAPTEDIISIATDQTPIVKITLDALRANADKEDADTAAGTLSETIRKALDKGGTNAALGGYSGRALAVMALNEDGSFSKAEIAAAKAELRERDRASAIAFLNGGNVTAASLKAYSQQMLAAHQQMSAEERLLRDNDPNLR